MNMYKFFSEMSSNRKEAIDDIKSKSPTVLDHFIKIVVYGSSNIDYKHWIGEIAEVLEDVSSIYLKPRKTKLYEKDYYEFLFKKLCDSRNEAEYRVDKWISTHVIRRKDYPYAKYDKRMASNLYKIYSELSHKLCSMIENEKRGSSGFQYYLKEDFEPVIEEYLIRLDWTYVN